ncbi:MULTISPECIES: helix-turn-helix domain-containing protein [unclassified Acinetobacter]|uniref:helix-turn-helix domain-containing protein n=1 Tax=unclassified Acinetobacter TaxID=196816 RepID=UPI00190BC2C4|nr:MULTISPECIES: AraC family transcriptional regulator [unclassified Acinetobacter]MBK0062766.1 helix-turn-helix transcriptional regulator [Acinetobacter sp. S55]MBK0065657.1 helix-turn-helix transcriptional regulator [Acinetobacter sp. S54]
MNNDLKFKLIEADPALSHYVESFWMLHNCSDEAKEIIVLPDGRMDLTLSQSSTQSFQIVCSGLETKPQAVILQGNALIFSISFKLLAVEYLLGKSISNLLNYAEYLPAQFWDFEPLDLLDFDLFCKKASKKIGSLLPQHIDSRKQKLFQLLYQSRGGLSVAELSEQVHWSRRQIHRYFTEKFGISLKTYCDILRFKASFESIRNGRLFPEQHFADQSHFIKHIKKFSGVSPKQLKLNHNDRFVQFLVLPSE